MLSDRNNWLLSWLVGVLLVANGVARVPASSGTVELVVAGALVVGGLLASSNAITAVRNPASVDDVEWTRNKTLLNAGATVLLALALVVALSRFLP
ncbi:MAG: hypothetical protein V5A44_04235 [Haloarculaceae archaeon]